MKFSMGNDKKLPLYAAVVLTCSDNKFEKVLDDVCGCYNKVTKEWSGDGGKKGKTPIAIPFLLKFQEIQTHWAW